MKTKHYESGQVGLLLLVILGLLLTLVMSIASRTLSDTSLARQEKEQSATFAVAESGVEEALRLIREGSAPSGAAGISDSLGLITGQYLVSEQNSIEIYLREGEVAQADLAGYGGLTIGVSWTLRSSGAENVSCVSEGSGNSPAAVELMFIDTSSGSVTRRYYNAASCGLSSNGFAASIDGGSRFLSSVSASIPAGSDLMRVRTFYNGATVSVTGVGLPSQQYLVQSQAEGGDSQKEIEVKRTLDAPPSVFDFALFSGTTILHN